MNHYSSLMRQVKVTRLLYSTEPEMALNTELTFACLRRHVMRFMSSLNGHAHNDIHGPLEEGYNPGRVEEGFKSTSELFPQNA